MTKDEALKLALEALENIHNWLPTIGQKGLRDYEADAITAIKEALAQPEQWTPEDMAYRPGGLPQPDQDQTEIAFEAWWQAHGQYCRAGGGDYEKTFAYSAWLASLAIPVQPEQEPTGCACRWDDEGDRTVTCARHEGWLEVIAEWADRAREAEKKLEALAQAEQEPCKGKNCGSTNPKLHSAECFDEHEFTVLNIKPFGYFEFVLDDGDGYWREIEDGGIDGKPLYTAPPQRQPLTEEQLDVLALDDDGLPNSHFEFARAIEAKHGIGDKT